MSDISYSEDGDSEYGQASVGTTILPNACLLTIPISQLTVTRNKRRRGATGRTIPTKRTTAGSSASDAEVSPLGPLHDALALTYADEGTQDVDFDSIILPVLSEYMEARAQYINRLTKDGLVCGANTSTKHRLTRFL